MIWLRTPPGCGSRSDPAIGQGFRPTALVAVAPSIERRSGDAELLQRPASRQMRLLDQPYDPGSCRRRTLSCLVSPIPGIMLFLSSRFSRVRSATTLSLRLAAKVLHFVRRRSPERCRRPIAASRLQEPSTSYSTSTSMPSRRHGDAVVPAQTLQHDANFVFGGGVPSRRAADVLTSSAGALSGSDFVSSSAPCGYDGSRNPP